MTWKVEEWFWESQPERVKASYSKPEESERYPKYNETRETLLEFGGDHPPKAKYYLVTDSA